MRSPSVFALWSYHLLLYWQRFISSFDTNTSYNAFKFCFQSNLRPYRLARASEQASIAEETKFLSDATAQHAKLVLGVMERLMAKSKETAAIVENSDQTILVWLRQ